MNKKILSVLLCGSLLFGTVFSNAVSINFDRYIHTNDGTIITLRIQSVRRGINALFRRIWESVWKRLTDR